MKKIAIVVGARPQFIKLVPLVKALSGRLNLVLVHTGQHYDFEMSDIFFRQLNLRQPDYHLGVGSARPASQTGLMMQKLEDIIRKETPLMVIVTGDTNSTLAGGLVAAQNGIPLAHIEAGLRASDKWLPEQINRVVTDRLSDILCCPTKTSITNLKNEGITRGVSLTGDILYDLVDMINPPEKQRREILERFGLTEGEFIFLTTHRAENVDDPDFLISLANGFERIGHPVFFPVHPRTLKNLQQYGIYDKLKSFSSLILSKPVGIIESLALTQAALGVITDSGGLQREAAYFGKKTYLLRKETEWIELAECGAVECIDRNLSRIDFAWQSFRAPEPEYFQKASKKIAGLLLECEFLA
jgi:UDP-N-acetylglucosamine 2-epimerase